MRHQGFVLCTAFAPDGTRIFSGSVAAASLRPGVVAGVGPTGALVELPIPESG